MLLNLKTEMLRRQVRLHDLAVLLNLSETQISRKVNENKDQEFKRSEMYLIRERFFPGVDLGYLFEAEK